MLNMLPKEEIDLSIVKEEQIEFDDYGQSNGNILDNFVSESEFDTIQDPNVACAEEDINVDWLSDFLDEPLHNNLSSLNPPLTNTVSTTNHTHSISKLSSINSANDSILLDTYPPLCNDLTNSSINDCFGMKTIKSPTLRNSNPMLSEVNKKLNPKKVEVNNFIVKDNIEEGENVEIKMEETINVTDDTTQNIPKKCADNINNILKNTEIEKPKMIPVKTQSSANCIQSQQKLLLFMNTPENRAKLAGANFNIINANLLSKLGNQNQIKANKPLLNDKPVNVVNVKRCVMNDPTRKEITKTITPVNTVNTSKKITNSSSLGASILLRKDKVNLVNELMQSNILQTIIKKEPENHEVDSGYESPTNSLSSSPLSPPIDVESTDKPNDTLQYIDVPPHERQPFYLSEEERRTLVIEGLPVPSGLPLNKMEERALKKVRRKIKNKISAQESRRKKKEYMEALEKKVDNYASENNTLKKKVNNLEMANRSLILQVEKLQAMIANTTSSNQQQVEDMDV